MENMEDRGDLVEEKKSSSPAPLLTVNNVSKSFLVKKGFLQQVPLWAVNNVSFEVDRSETFGIVGESGCGKSTLGRCILRLIDVTEGEIHLDGEDLTKISQHHFREYRSKVNLVFQDPTDSLNPRKTIGGTLHEPLRLHTDLDFSQRQERIIDVLKVVGLTEEHLGRFPHQLSTGQQQRVCVARAMVLYPKLVVLDEPTSALDVSVRGRLLNLLKKIQEETDVGYIFISHDLSVIKHFCDTTGIMYLGSMVEHGPNKELFKNPLHPYTSALISAIPIPDPRIKTRRILLEGEVPSPLKMPSGCPFNTRCYKVETICREKRPHLVEYKDDHWVACHNPNSSSI